MQRLKYMYQPQDFTSFTASLVQLRVILYGDVRVMNALTDVLAKDETGSAIIFAQASRVMSEVVYIDTRISFQNGLVQQYRLRVSGVRSQ